MGSLTEVGSTLAACVVAAASCCSLASAASTTSPAEYRAVLNRVCQINLKHMNQYDAAMNAAQKSRNWGVYYRFFGRQMGLVLNQDHLLEAAPVPAALRSKMRAAQTDAYAVDAHLSAALSKAPPTGTARQFMSEVAKAASFMKPLRRHLRSAGLDRCAAVYD